MKVYKIFNTETGEYAGTPKRNTWDNIGHAKGAMTRELKFYRDNEGAFVLEEFILKPSGKTFIKKVGLWLER